MNLEKNNFEKEKKFEIQIATLEDLKDIQDLNHQLCEKESREFDPTIDPEFPFTEVGEEYFKDRIENGQASIAKVDNKIVGYLVMGIAYPEAYRKNIKVAEAENTYILPEYRSLGIGKKFFQEFFDWAKAQGAKRMKVVASAQNERAIEFYKREGLENYDVTLEREI